MLAGRKTVTVFDADSVSVGISFSHLPGAKYV